MNSSAANRLRGMKNKVTPDFNQGGGGADAVMLLMRQV